MASHRTIELRSIELHRLVASRLRDEPELVVRARARADRWEAQGALHPEIARAWRRLLDADVDELAAAIIRDDEEMRDLRQSSPLSCEVPNAERLAIIRRLPTVGSDAA